MVINQSILNGGRTCCFAQTPIAEICQRLIDLLLRVHHKWDVVHDGLPAPSEVAWPVTRRSTVLEVATGDDALRWRVGIVNYIS